MSVSGGYLGIQIKHRALRSIIVYRECVFREVLPAFANLNERANRIATEYSRSCRFPPLIHAVRGQGAKRQLRDRTPKCFAHFHEQLRAEGSCGSVVKSYLRGGSTALGFTIGLTRRGSIMRVRTEAEEYCL